ncbi:MAG: fatty acid desaturase [Paracoccaceae bacterium]|nr:fatty acid desaturase [Paracoccaceae bacterium]
MSAVELRQKYNPRFKGLSRYSNLRGWVIVGSFVGQIVLAAGLGHLVIGTGLSAWSVLLAAALMLFIGTRLRALNNIVHETSHASFVEDRAQNVLIGKVCSALTMGSFLDYRDEHLSHHSHVGDYQRDLDFQGIEHLALHDPLTRRVLLRHIFTPLIGRHLPYYLHLNLSRRDGALYSGLKGAILLTVLALAFMAPLTAILFLILPFALIYSALNYWADCMDHAGLVGGADELDKSRNILAPRAIGWLFFPRYDSYHLVHHLFPHVPARHLPATHQLLTHDAVYRSKPNAMGGAPITGLPESLANATPGE